MFLRGQGPKAFVNQKEARHEQTKEHAALRGVLRNDV